MADYTRYTYSGQITAGAFIVSLAAAIWRALSNEPADRATSTALLIVAIVTALTALSCRQIEASRRRP